MSEGIGDGYTLTLKEASQKLRMPSFAVLKCISYTPRPGGIKLKRIDRLGIPFFSQIDIDTFLDDLSKPWPPNKSRSRPAIPDYFVDALRHEVGYRCGLCAEPYAQEFAHIIPYKECKHNHPWNLISLCVKCHKGYDIEKRITREEIKRAKDRATAQLEHDLLYDISEDQCLSRLKSISIPINGTSVTGIDILLSMLLVANSQWLHISKARVVSMLKAIVKGELNDKDLAPLIRLTETSIAHLSHSRIASPFWDEFATEIYSNSAFPNLPIELNITGKRLIERLQNQIDNLICLKKYNFGDSISSLKILEQFVENICNESAHFEAKERLIDETLETIHL